VSAFQTLLAVDGVAFSYLRDYFLVLLATGAALLLTPLRETWFDDIQLCTLTPGLVLLSLFVAYRIKRVRESSRARMNPTVSVTPTPPTPGSPPFVAREWIVALLGVLCLLLFAVYSLFLKGSSFKFND
jgi:hypothetical protein